MEFGFIPPADLDKVDFTLAPEPSFNSQVFTTKSTAAQPAVFIGCGKWGRKEWLGKIFPEGTKEKDFLSHYVSQFNSIELNATFFKVYGKETISGWAEKAKGKDFRFCPKGSRALTNNKDLTSPFVQHITKAFIEGISAFEDHLGPYFLQFDEHFSPARKENLYAFLQSLPSGYQAFVEVRHPDWFADKATMIELFSNLRKLNIGAVITDVAGRRDCCHMHLPLAKAFIRFTGNHLHPTDFTRLDQWVKRIQLWSKKGLKELYFFMHHPEEKESPELCEYLIKQLNKKCKWKLSPPKFENVDL